MYSKVLLDDWWEPVIEESKIRLEKTGIFFEDMSFDLGRDRYIELSEVSVNLDNTDLLNWLCEADDNWKRLVDMLCFENLIDSKVHVSEVVDVEEVKCGKRGVYVRLSVSGYVDELQEKLGLEDIEMDVREMENTLEGILRDEAKMILKALEKEYQTIGEQMVED